MLHMNNLEPRRSWRKEKYQEYYWAEIEQEGCLSCGGPTRSQHVDRLFCGDCLEWSRQSNLDECWDDLGGPG
jgi:ribosomal protein S27AE